MKIEMHKLNLLSSFSSKIRSEEDKDIELLTILDKFEENEYQKNKDKGFSIANSLALKAVVLFILNNHHSNLPVTKWKEVPNRLYASKNNLIQESIKIGDFYYAPKWDFPQGIVVF